MNIAIIGSGYVGLVSGICLAHIGHKVICVDKDDKKIHDLKNNIIPIYEPGLEELLKKSKNNINFTTNLAVALDEVELVIIAVGTPQNEDGSADLKYVFESIREIAQKSKDYKLVVTKSTVPIGTGYKIREIIKEINPQLDFDIASNPEFLREGFAVQDFLEPDRIIIGTESDKSKKLLVDLYSHFDEKKIFKTDIITSEMIKYASNTFLATKIAFINEMANLCEKTGGNIKDLSRGMGLDERIGSKFLNPGPGFGGSCFPKDIQALKYFASSIDIDLMITDAVIKTNYNRQIKLAKNIINFVNNEEKSLNKIKKEPVVTFLGLAFKANTDDVRCSPAIFIIKEVLKAGLAVKLHDPKAMENSKKELAGFKNVSFCEEVEDAIDSDIIVIATEWPQYAELDFKKLRKKTKATTIYDLRNILDGEKVIEAGFRFANIGQRNIIDNHN